MKAVATTLGISVARLAKICDRFQIPYPASTQRGKAPQIREMQPPLPSQPAGNSETITITSARARLGTGTQPLAQIPGNREVRKHEHYHPELKSWLRSYLAWQQQFNLKSGPRIPPNLLRLLRVLNLIFRAAQRKGLTPKLTAEPRLRFFHFVYEDVPVACELRETKSRNNVARSTSQSRELQPSGYLLFRLQNISRKDLPSKTEWNEKHDGPLSKNVDGIVQAILLAGPVVVRINNEQRESHRRWKAQLLELEQRRAIAKREAALRHALYEAVSDYRTARDLRELITGLEAGMQDCTIVVGGRAVADWLAWARVQLDLIDPLSHGAARFFEHICKAANSASSESP